VAEDHLHDLDGHTAHQQQRTSAVTHVMESDHRKLACLGMGLELLRHSGWTQRLAVELAENQAVVVVVRPEQLALSLLGHSVRRQGSAREHGGLVRRES
jgi:hypothetical protein